MTAIYLALLLLLHGASEREMRWLLRQAWIESRGNSDAVSYRGQAFGCGILQVSSVAARHYGVDDSCENRKRLFVSAFVGLNVLRLCVKVHGWERAEMCYERGVNHASLKEKK